MASSIGLRSGEYGGKYSILTPKKSSVLQNVLNLVVDFLTETIGKFKNLVSMVNPGIVHHQHAEGARICHAFRELRM